MSHTQASLAPNGGPRPSSFQQPRLIVKKRRPLTLSYCRFRDRHSFRFEGVRYAAQPERFTYSSVYEAKNETTALSFGSQCVQAGNVGSEDCLFLNIWTPYLPKEGNTSESLKPVMFLIHGGAFTGGTGSDSTFDGSGLASRGDVVLVTINYRLTTLGFLALDDGVTNGNFGLADQITALDWVRENIRDFGGDPERITIFGQSAGAASVRALMGSPKAIGKFAAAIPQSNLAGSNYATTYSQYYNLSTEISVAAEPILNATGCLNATSTSQVDCLRQVNAYTLANLTTVARYLVVDGTYIVSDGLEVTGKGQSEGGGSVANVPVMMGFMRDDGAMFIGYPKANDTLGTFLPTQGFQLGNTTLDAFGVPSGPNSTLDVFNASALIATDSEFRCLDLATAYSAVNHGTIDTIYFYQFNRSYQTPGYDPNAPVCDAPVEPGYPHGNPEGEYFKCHSGELYYTFGTVAYQGLVPRDGNDIPMAQMAVDRWAAFARNHDPNPEMAFLAARGFTNTTAEVARSGKWNKVGKSGAGDGDGDGERDTGGQTLRVLQWPSFESSFEFHSSHEQCASLGFPLDYYETAL
jgi:carboxylesterase type B